MYLIVASSWCSHLPFILIVKTAKQTYCCPPR